MTEIRTGAIYVISGNLKCRAVYVGQTTDPRKRWFDHRTRLRSGTSGNRKLQSAFTKYGESEFRFIVVERCAVEALTEREQAWLDCFRAAGVRILNCGECASPPRRGVRHTDEARAKMSAANLGRRPSPEARARMSAAMIGRKMSADAIRKSADSRRGFRHTEEAKRKMSESSKGKIASEETRQKISNAVRGRVVTLETRARIGAARLGQKHKPETIAKLRESKRLRDSIRLKQEMLTGKT